MHFKILFLSALYATGLSVAQNEKRDSSSLDMASVLSEASRLTSAYPGSSATYSIPFVTPGGNLLQPPASLIPAIITGIPATVIVQIAGASGRSVLASEFKAGNTPAWYQSLPDGVKSYINALASQASAGSINLSATPTAVNWATAPQTTSSASADGKGNVKSSKSKGIGAQPTAAPLGIGIAAAVGILGVALAL